MRTIFIVFTFIYSVALSAQQSVLHGRVSVFNSQFETGTRQFIVNAQIEEDYGKSQATFTGIDGCFHLPLITAGTKAGSLGPTIHAGFTGRTHTCVTLDPGRPRGQW